MFNIYIYIRLFETQVDMSPLLTQIQKAHKNTSKNKNYRVIDEQFMQNFVPNDQSESYLLDGKTLVFL